jgi:AraC family transcriptional regulator, glycine betaine-responsive activator
MREPWLIVCGGLDIHRNSDKRLINWLRKAARRGMGLGAVCTGAHILAEAGVLDGYACTIHWENLPGFSEEFPEIDVTGSLFEIDRDRFTSAGGTSPLDMMLTLISSQHGPELASMWPNSPSTPRSATTMRTSACHCRRGSGRAIPSWSA